MIGKPATKVSRAEASASPLPVTTPMSADVPPTSKVTRWSRPEARPAWAPPSTPAAGPESSSVTGSRAACATGATPPFERMTWMRPPKPACAARSASRSRYARTGGPT